VAYNILSASEDAHRRGRWLTAASLAFVVEALVFWRGSGDGPFVSLFPWTRSRNR
jgi:hypothetical protein